MKPESKIWFEPQTKVAGKWCCMSHDCNTHEKAREEMLKKQDQFPLSEYPRRIRKITAQVETVESKP